MIALGAAAGPFRTLARTPRALVERASYAMGSIVTVKAYAEDARLCHAAIDEAFRAMKAVDALMSVYSPGSAVSALNRGASAREVPCPAELLDVLEAAAGYHWITGGAFDVTMEPLMELYGFRGAPGPGRFPTDRELAKASAGVGMQNVLLNRTSSTVAFAHPRTRIDLGGIAVGHALDLSGTILRARGITSALLNHSGDILAIGAPPDEDGWEIGITDPTRPGEIIATAAIRDEALSTSGNYRNVRTIGGRPVGHILDPADGRPAASALSGTVIAPKAIAADALSTGSFVLGKERSDKALRVTGARTIIVARDGAGRLRVLRG
jgi:thiamine biosynthesis lipoprotein